MTFLTGNTGNFFRPLTGKWRNVVRLCIHSMHARLYGDQGLVYGAEPLVREDLRNLFVAAVRESAHLVEETDANAVDDLGSYDASDEYRFANGILRDLIEKGWIEVDDDKWAMTQTYRFSRVGRVLADSLVNIEQPPIKTRQRNVRKTAALLEAYLQRRVAYDLIDAHACAQSVVRDFADDIAELNERRHQLLHEALMRPAIDEFLEYIETKFTPDLSIRLSADSVEVHHETIRVTIGRIRKLPIEQLRTAQEELRSALHGQAFAESSKPLLFLMLDRIEDAVQNACDAKLPELRSALHAYVQRSSIMIRQASSLLGGHALQQLRQVLEYTARLSDEDREHCFKALAERMAISHVRRIDPARLGAAKQREVENIPLELNATPPTREELLQAAIVRAQSHAFSLNLSALREEMLPRVMESGKLRLSDLSIDDAPNVLTSVFSLSALASVSMGPQCVHVKELEGMVTSKALTMKDIEFTPR